MNPIRLLLLFCSVCFVLGSCKKEEIHHQLSSTDGKVWKVDQLLLEDGQDATPESQTFTFFREGKKDDWGKLDIIVDNGFGVYEFPITWGAGKKTGEIILDYENGTPDLVKVTDITDKSMSWDYIVYTLSWGFTIDTIETHHYYELSLVE